MFIHGFRGSHGIESCVTLKHLEDIISLFFAYAAAKLLINPLIGKFFGLIKAI